MGTSKSASTPKGGTWQPLKTELTRAINQGKPVNAPKVVRQVVVGFGGLSPGAAGASGGGAAGGSGATHAGGGSTAQASAARASVGRAVSSLAGFGAAVRNSGLDAGLDSIGIGDLTGRSAAEVIGKIADKISTSGDGQQSELMRTALQGAILEASQLSAGSYADLEAGLQTFLQVDGVEGLVLLFLAEFAASLVWYAIESHVDQKTNSLDSASAIQSAIRVYCEGKVQAIIDREKSVGTFGTVDWFGSEGIARAQSVSLQLEQDLTGSGE